MDKQDVGRDRFGSFELKRIVGPNLLRGFLIAVLLHGAVVASPSLLDLIIKDHTPPVVVTIKLPPDVKLFPKRPRENIPTTVTPTPPVKPPEVTMVLPVDSEAVSPGDPQLPSRDEMEKYFRDKEKDSEPDFPPGRVVEFIEPDSETAGLIPPPDSFVFVEVEPAVLETNPQPRYPELARQTGLSGKVTIKVYVDRWGNAQKWMIMKADPEGLGFEDEVLKVIPEWKFTPAIQSGKPIGVWVAVPFRFEFKR